MRKLLLAAVLLLPAAALGWDLPKSPVKLPDKVQKQANDAAHKGADQAEKKGVEEGKSAAGVLNHDDSVAFCAEQLPHQLECKEDFCTAMVELRIANDTKFADVKKDATKVKALHDQCLKEIATDGTGDEAARKKRCEGWSKDRGDLPITKTMAGDMKACWAKPNCGERVSCWKPMVGVAMEAAKAEKKVPGTK
jgi:hypothetical protein